MENKVKRIEINLGYACNNNCVFCGEDENRRIYMRDLAAKLTLDRVKDEIAQFSRDGYNHITFLGGEPTIRRDFIEIVLFARTLGFETIFLTTNGRMLRDARYAKDLIEAGVTEICLSLHGPASNVHDTLTQSMRSFTQTLKAMENLREIGKRFSTSTVITRLGFQLLPELTRLILSFDPMRMLYSYPICNGGALANFDTVVPRFSESMPFVAESIELASEKDVMMTVGQSPFCVMLGYEAYADILYWGGGEATVKRVVRKFSARHVEDGRVVDVHGENKVKKKVCRPCMYRRLCEGVDHRYAEHAGVTELKTIPGELMEDPETLKSRTYFYHQIDRRQEGNV